MSTKKKGCPYADGTDIWKLHHLFMSRENALAVDEQIAAARSPRCGKPIHPGSCMCQEHLKWSYGYKERPIEYPAPGAPFTCQHSPPHPGTDKRWILHDKNEHFCAEFETEEEAKRTVDTWTEHGADKVILDWKAPPDDADDSDRGTYIITVDGTKLRREINAGWHSMEYAAMESARLRKLIVKNGNIAAAEFKDYLAA